jgi:hypothetical protein
MTDSHLVSTKIPYRTEQMSYLYHMVMKMKCMDTSAVVPVYLLLPDSFEIFCGPLHEQELNTNH